MKNIFSHHLLSISLKDMERLKLEKFRQEMVEDMKEKGVNEKYFGEMKTIDIKKLLMK